MSDKFDNVYFDGKCVSLTVLFAGGFIKLNALRMRIAAKPNNR